MSNPKSAVLLDEFNVQVHADGRIRWDRLDKFLKRHEDARRRLTGLMAVDRPSRRTTLLRRPIAVH